MDKCYPEFDIWTQFVADTFAQFLIPDALKSSHPIEVPIGKFIVFLFPYLLTLYFQVILPKLMKFLMLYHIPKVLQ